MARLADRVIFVSGTTAFLAPRVSIDGIGAIAFPLLPAQAEQLVAQAERAPFGRGEETLIDIEVRRTWQIDPGRIRIEGKHWPATLGSILAEVAESLGVTGTVNAELYKLLIYDHGSFFVPHRDTEKVSGMFATLVLVLPSLAEGGELIVRHKDREIRLDLRCEDPSELRFAAFYADCVHEVLPVTAGYRLALVYNLVRCGKGELPRPPDYSTEQARIEALLTTWVEGKRSPEDDTPEKLVYPLDHAYTPAELGFDRLKGADAAVAPVLVAAARRSDCDLHLALVSVEESGSAEHTGGYGRYRRRSEPEEEYEMGEIFDRSVTASHWCRPDAGTSILMELPIEEEEFSPPGSLDDIEPDEVHFHDRQ